MGAGGSVSAGGPTSTSRPAGVGDWLEASSITRGRLGHPTAPRNDPVILAAGVAAMITIATFSLEPHRRTADAKKRGE